MTRTSPRLLALAFALAIITFGMIVVVPRVAHSAQGTSLWIGDSYTKGYRGGSAANSGSCVAAAQEHWKCVIDAEGGTGFIANGHQSLVPAIAESAKASADVAAKASAIASTLDSYTALPGRLVQDAVKYPNAGVIVIDAGRNDTDSAELRTTVTNYLAHVRAIWPQAQVVVVLPYFLTKPGQALGDGFATFYKAAAKSVGATIIDPVAEGWAQPKSLAGLISDDNIHPNAKGYRYIGDHLDAALEAQGI